MIDITKVSEIDHIDFREYYPNKLVFSWLDNKLNSFEIYTIRFDSVLDLMLSTQHIFFRTAANTFGVANNSNLVAVSLREWITYTFTVTTLIHCLQMFWLRLNKRCCCCCCCFIFTLYVFSSIPFRLYSANQGTHAYEHTHTNTYSLNNASDK